MKLKQRNIVYSIRTKSTFMIQSWDEYSNRWYCYLVDGVTHEPILRQTTKYGYPEPIHCFVFEYDVELVESARTKPIEN